ISSARQRRLDRALDILVNGERRLLHGEWQLRMAPAVPFRIYEYNVLLVLALADELAIPPISPIFPAHPDAPIDPDLPGSHRSRARLCSSPAGKSRGPKRESSAPRRWMPPSRGCASGSSLSTSARWPSSLPRGACSG